MITIREPLESELVEMYQLRWKLNRKPFGLAPGTEVDDKEAESHRVIVVDENTTSIIGSARLLVAKNDCEIDFVGVDESYQKQGIGRKLMEVLHNKARDLKLKKINLSARKSAEGFYKSLGYVPLEEHFCGPPYNITEVAMEFRLA
ncbi:MAG: GNAT family N-acetyltransferase [Patescibacteria group bacterium]